MFFHRTQFSQNSDPTVCMSLPSRNREGSSSLSVPDRRTSSINIQNFQQNSLSGKECVLSPNINEYHTCLPQQPAGMTRCARTSSLTSHSVLTVPEKPYRRSSRHILRSGNASRRSCRSAPRAPCGCTSHSPCGGTSRPPCRGASGSLTVEAALELPLFFILIAIILQYAVVFRAAAQFSGAMTTTAEEMAIAAYKEEYDDANSLIRGALSDAWAASQVTAKAADKDAVRYVNFAASSFLRENDRICLVLSYQPKPKYSLISLPFTFFVQKATVRGWTGRLGSGHTKGSGADEDDPHRDVYVTDHGSVYHTDPNCSHLKVTVIPTTKEGLKKARNKSGSKYHRCPYCSKSGGDHILIDPYGECWHTTLDCPSLKRSVNTVHLDECGHLSECKDCRRKRK